MKTLEMLVFKSCLGKLVGNAGVSESSEECVGELHRELEAVRLL